MRTFITGICGGSASGKTTLANELAEALGRDNTNIIALDNYYLDFVNMGHDPATINYDHPDSIDIKGLASDLKQLQAGSSVEIPVYDFTTHTRSARRNSLFPRRFTIVEGLFLFNIPLLSPLFDIKIYIDTPEDIRLERRIDRDTKERNRTPQSVQEQFYRNVSPMHRTFVEPNRKMADLVVDGNKNLAGQIPGILKLIKLKSEL